MAWSPSFRCVWRADGEQSWRVGHDQVDEFLEFAHGRARPSTVRAYAHDLKVFFSVVAKEPAEVTSRDVLDFVSAQQRPRAGADKGCPHLRRRRRDVGVDDRRAGVGSVCRAR